MVGRLLLHLLAVLYLSTNELSTLSFLHSQECPGSPLFQNSTFTLNFDIGTPRPHFIILFKGKRSQRVSVKDLTEAELVSVLELCEDFIGSINAKSEEFTLAFHTGKWVSLSFFCCPQSL